METFHQAISDSKLVILPPFSLGEKGRLWILEPNQVAFEVATRLRAKNLIVFDTHPLPQFDESDSLDEAVRLAKNKAEKGDVVLLSPACASFDMFEDYIDRGNQFKSIIKTLEG